MQITSGKPLKVSEIEIHYRSRVKSTERPRITKSKDAYDLFIQSWDMNKIELVEQFKIMLLNRSNVVLGVMDISSGGMNHTIVDIRLILSAALKTASSSILLAHNHSFGSIKPSKADQALTKRICLAASLMDVKVLDHVIVTKRKYFSFIEAGLI